MRLQPSFRNKIEFITIFLFLFLILVSPSKALTIFSPLVEMTVEPGSEQKGVVKVYNETTEPLYVTSSIENFKAGDEEGAAVIDPEQKGAHLEWFSLTQTELTLLPKQVAIVPFTVKVPLNATPGGYYTAIFWQTQPGEIKNNSAVGISSKVGTLIFLQVSGPVKEEGRIIEYSLKPTKGIYWQLPLNFTTRFENAGNIHLKPTGAITISSWGFNKATLPINQEKRNVLPQSVRRFDVIFGQTHQGINEFWSGVKDEWQNFLIGKCRAQLSLSFSEPQQTLNQEIVFWYFPLRLLICFAALILFIILFFSLNRKIKKIKRSVQKS